MANEDNKRIAPPISFLTAVWAGMTHEDIMAGLRAGDIIRPGRMPDWAAGLDVPSNGGNSTGEPANATGPVDKARVGAWFTSLDPDLTPTAFDAIWCRAGAERYRRAGHCPITPRVRQRDRRWPVRVRRVAHGDIHR